MTDGRGTTKARIFVPFVAFRKSLSARITKDVSRNSAPPQLKRSTRLQFFEPKRYKLTRARVEEVVIQNSGFNASSHSGLSYLRITATSSPAHPSAPHPAASSVPKSIAACGFRTHTFSRPKYRPVFKSRNNTIM